MAPKRPQLLGPLELEIMKVLWELEDASVAEVLERLPAKKRLHHNTVMTVMNRLESKDLLRRYARDGRSYGYRPRVTQEDISRQYLDLVKEQFFGGSVSQTVAAFLGQQKLSERRAKSLQRWLDEMDEE